MSTPPESHAPSGPRLTVDASLHEGGTSPRAFAVLAYLIPLVGGIIGLAVDGSNPLTLNHARQSIAAVLTMILSFLVWIVGGYLIGLIPIIGPIVAISLFSLVMAMAVFLLVNWVYSLIVAARGQERTIPFANKMVIRLFGDVRKSKSAGASA